MNQLPQPESTFFFLFSFFYQKKKLYEINLEQKNITPTKVLQLEGCKIQASTVAKHCFEIITPDKKCAKFCAETFEQSLEWINSFISF